jgi:hypothetical protein
LSSIFPLIFLRQNTNRCIFLRFALFDLNEPSARRRALCNVIRRPSPFKAAVGVDLFLPQLVPACVITPITTNVLVIAIAVTLFLTAPAANSFVIAADTNQSPLQRLQSDK